MNQAQLTLLDEAEAPTGYRAVLKSDAKPEDGSNICRACDWRPVCQDPATDLTLHSRRHNHRCMAHAITDQAGNVIKRRDGCGVVFKRVRGGEGTLKEDGEGRRQAGSQAGSQWDAKAGQEWQGAGGANFLKVINPYTVEVTLERIFTEY